MKTVIVKVHAVLLNQDKIFAYVVLASSVKSIIDWQNGLRRKDVEEGFISSYEISVVDSIKVAVIDYQL